MPIYEYQCQRCGYDYEALQKVSDSPLRKCPECGRLSLKRLVSAPRFRLAGSGWYETDFKSDQEKKRNLHEKGDGKTAAGAEKASDAKSKQPSDKAGTPGPAKSPVDSKKPGKSSSTKPAAD